MRHTSILSVLAIFLLLSACKKTGDTLADDTGDEQSSSDSFLPLQVGNYWKLNEQNYTEVKAAIRINGEIFYQVYSLIGGDGVSQDYLRIDADQQLISSSPSDPKYHFIQAKFNGKVGDTFQTIGDQSVNDFKVTITAKTDKLMTFSYDRIYHPNLIGHPHTVTFLRRLGWDSSWKIASIGGKVITK